jgi:hypothetical protein
MRALSFFLSLAVLSLSLLALACRHRADTPDAASGPAPEADASASQRPPPGTRIEEWPELGAWSATRHELPGSRDPFLWERPAAPEPPKAQIPLRLHRPID